MTDKEILTHIHVGKWITLDDLNKLVRMDRLKLYFCIARYRREDKVSIKTINGVLLIKKRKHIKY